MSPSVAPALRPATAPAQNIQFLLAPARGTRIEVRLDDALVATLESWVAGAPDNQHTVDAVNRLRAEGATSVVAYWADAPFLQGFAPSAGGDLLQLVNPHDECWNAELICPQLSTPGRPGDPVVIPLSHLPLKPAPAGITTIYNASATGHLPAHTFLPEQMDSGTPWEQREDAQAPLDADR